MGDYFIIDRFVYYYNGYPLKTHYHHNYIDQIKMFNFSKSILDDFLDTGEYDSRLPHIFPQNQLINIINDNFKYWTKSEGIYNFIIDTFGSKDYGSNEINLDILKESFSKSIKYNISESIENIKNNYDIFNNKVRIYRGVQSKSSSLEKSLSWSLNKYTALFFASRFPSDSNYVYETLIDLDKIIGFIKREDEVLVEFKNITDKIITESIECKV